MTGLTSKCVAAGRAGSNKRVEQNRRPALRFRNRPGNLCGYILREPVSGGGRSPESFAKHASWSEPHGSPVGTI